jgi:hypothetical protein
MDAGLAQAAGFGNMMTAVEQTFSVNCGEDNASVVVRFASGNAGAVFAARSGLIGSKVRPGFGGSLRWFRAPYEPSRIPSPVDDLSV